MKEDPCRIKHAEICIRCDEIQVRDLSGIRWYVCSKCAKKMADDRNYWEKYGLYAEKKDSTNAKP